MLNNLTIWALIVAALNFDPRRTQIVDLDIPATLADLIATGGFQLLRIRWNGVENALKYTGQSEDVDPTSITPGTRYWRWLESNISQFALWACYTEDTIASGADTDVQDYILDQYGLAL